MINKLIIHVLGGHPSHRFRFASYPVTKENYTGKLVFGKAGMHSAWGMVLCLGSFFISFCSLTVLIDRLMIGYYSWANCLWFLIVSLAAFACSLVFENKIDAFGNKLEEFYYNSFLFLHNRLSGKEKRVNEIFLKFEKKKVVLVENPHFALGLAPVDLDPENFNKEYKEIGGKEFCKKYFNKTGSSFIAFMDERVKVTPLFIYQALNIPRRTELSIDALRKILLTIHPSCQFGSIKKVINKDICFQNYTLAELERILTSFSDKNILYTLPNTPLAVAISLSELEIKPIPSEIKALDGLESGELKFEVLKNTADYERTSNEFSNCVRHRNILSSFILIVRKGEAKSCVEINGVDVTQIAGPRDQPCPFKDEITLVLKDLGFKIVKDYPHMGVV